MVEPPINELNSRWRRIVAKEKTRFLTRQELSRRLAELAASTPPTANELTPGAMCYAKKSFSGTVEVACSQCKKLTHFKDGYSLVELDHCQRLVQAIKNLPTSLDIELDTRFYCAICNDERDEKLSPQETPQQRFLEGSSRYASAPDGLDGLYLILRFSEEEKRRVNIDSHGLRLLLAFLQNKDRMEDAREREHALQPAAAAIGQLLGLLD